MLDITLISLISGVSEMKAAVLEDKRDCERKLRVANHQSICGCNLQLELLREKVPFVCRFSILLQETVLIRHSSYERGYTALIVVI